MGTVASLLADRVTFRCTSVDRLFLNGYVPGLQSEGQVVRFLLSRGFSIPSPAGLGQNHDRLERDINRFIADSDVPLVRFARRQNKEDTARPLLAEAASAGEERVVLVGVAQENVSAWRGRKNGGSASHPHFSYGRQSLFVNHHYFYAWDDQWGPVFVKLCGYAPYPMWVYCNGHEWAKRQLTHQGIGFEALDNGLRSCADPVAAHRVCARLAAGHVKSLLARWTARLPSPLTPADHANGFSYAWSIRQLEISDTAVFDRPADGRTWFNAAIRDHLDLGRPDKVRLIVDRRIVNRGPHATPGTFETRIVTRDVTPTIQVHYKSSKVKAYLKEGRALRVETTINNPNDLAPPPPDATALAPGGGEGVGCGLAGAAGRQAA